MAKKKLIKKEPTPFRQCANIKSKRYPDVQCPYAATQGNYCSRHVKNPTLFQKKGKEDDLALPAMAAPATTKIQTWWRLVCGLLRFKRQGPAASSAISENETDLYTLDTVANIPILYRWSYADTRKHIWLFDIRSLNMALVEDTNSALSNPYTREEIPAVSLAKFQERCSYLRDKKYCIVHMLDTELTPTQIWHQRLLDTVMKYDMLGYHTCLHWFEELTVLQLYHFYEELWELWHYRLQLNPQVKQQVVPNWNQQDSLLFKWYPHEIRGRTEKKWWQKMMLDVLDRLVSSAQLKEHKTLGALYGMTAFAIVSPRVRINYPWLVEMPEDD